MTKTSKTLTALAAAATIGLVAVAAPQPAEARNGGAIAAGIIGGLAVGALIGAAAIGPSGYGPGYALPVPDTGTVVATDPSACLGRMGLRSSCGLRRNAAKSDNLSHEEMKARIRSACPGFFSDEGRAGAQQISDILEQSLSRHGDRISLDSLSRSALPTSPGGNFYEEDDLRACDRRRAGSG
jgi:hypothetical protein